MPTIKDIVVRKPTEQEDRDCKAWPTWRCEPSTFDWAYTEKETWVLLEGKVTVTGGEAEVSFGAGDLVIFPEGLDCVWDVTVPVRKHYKMG